MLRAMLLSRPKPPQAGAEGQPLQGNSSQRQLSTKVSGPPPCRCLNPWPSGRIDCLGAGNSPTENSKEPQFFFQLEMSRLTFRFLTPVIL